MHHLQTTKETEGSWPFPPFISQVSVNICCIRFEKKKRQRRIWQAINTIISYAKLFRNEIIQLVMMSLYNIASLRDRVRPQGVYGDRKTSIVHPFPVSFLCIVQIQASISQMPNPPNFFRKRQILQPWLSTPRANLRWKDMTLSVQIPHPSQAKAQIP